MKSVSAFAEWGNGRFTTDIIATKAAPFVRVVWGAEGFLLYYVEYFSLISNMWVNLLVWY